MLYHPSPNFGERPMAPDTVILHYTGMQSAAQSLSRLCDPAAEVSAHYLIDEDGIVYELVHPDKRAWHAGISYWAGRENANDWSIGIELQNPGHDFGYRAFSDRQIDALLTLLTKLDQHYAIPKQNYLGHSDVAPDRKIDPGEFFPWQRLADAGFGLWPDPPPDPLINQTVNEGPVPASPFIDIEEQLSAIGYRCGTDVPTQTVDDAVMAFCRHWYPDAVISKTVSTDLAAPWIRQVAACFAAHRLAS